MLYEVITIEGLDYSRKRKTLTIVNFQTDKPQKFFLDEEAKAIDEKIHAKIPEYTFLVTRKNKDEDKLLVYVYSDRYFGGYVITSYSIHYTKLYDLPWEQALAPVWLSMVTCIQDLLPEPAKWAVSPTWMLTLRLTAVVSSLDW